MIRVEAGMSTTRFCQLIDMPERTWRRWQAKARAARPPKGPWPRPARCAAIELAPACVGASGVGTSQDLGHGPPRRARRVRGHRVAAVAR